MRVTPLAFLVGFVLARVTVAQAAPQLLHGVDASALPQSTREHVLGVQRRIDETHAALGRSTLAISDRGVDPRLGFTSKLVVRRMERGKFAGQYLFKRMAATDAKKLESMTLLANLLGVETALAIPHALKEKGSRFTASDGVLMPWVPAHEVMPDHDFSKMSKHALETLVVSRWFNEVVGNQDVWWGQFMRPKGAARHDQILPIDLDGAFVKREPEVVQKVLREHFGIHRPIADTKWTDRKFDFDAPLGWSPEHYDSKFTMYGPLFAAYVEGTIDLDMNAIKARLAGAHDVPKSAIHAALGGWLDAASTEHWGHIPVQAAERFMARDEVESKLEQRIDHSIEQFGHFLDELTVARKNPASAMYRFYQNMDDRF